MAIASLAHQFIGLEQDGGALFDLIVVITDRKVPDQQIKDTIGNEAHSSQGGRMEGMAGDRAPGGDLLDIPGHGSN